MVNFYNYRAHNFKGKPVNLTIASGPVIFNDKKEFLLHRSESSGKYQFIGGRLDCKKTLRENAIFRAAQEGFKVLLKEVEPFVIVDEIKRNKEKEIVVLIHYLAELDSKVMPESGEWGWFSIDQIKDLEKKDDVSTPNILLAAKFFLKR
jgi:ADP-ribose pyrophosphatase YjhB (NUDIX family)